MNADQVVNNLANTLHKDIIDIQYHTEYPAQDRMYADNPIPANARGLYYGISKVPYAMINGGIDDPILELGGKYDFSTSTPDSTGIMMRSLLNPDFSINLDIFELLPSLQLKVRIEALKDIPKKELTLFTVVLERKIEDMAYAGSNGVQEFENIARKMLPDAGGITFNQIWEKGDFELVTISADSPQRKDTVLSFLKERQASCRNYLFNSEDTYQLVEAVGKESFGGIPYTILIKPGGQIIYRRLGLIDPLELKKVIVEYVGRTYR